ncbi:MAG: hypothetical protein U5K74_12860 [Gemmatimonadaceae bacterium]|nr:hypothetical protein [Gemmatimonadaceae bacterium]
MLIVLLALVAILLISSAGARRRLETKVIADIEGDRYQETPGTAKIVAQLRTAGVVTDVDGRMVIDAAQRAARAKAGAAQMVRQAIIVVSVAGLIAIATKLLLDRSGG